MRPRENPKKILSYIQGMSGVSLQPETIGHQDRKFWMRGQWALQQDTTSAHQTCPMQG